MFLHNKDTWKGDNNPIHKVDNSGENNPMYGKIPHNYKPEGSQRKDGYVRLTVNGKRVLKHRHIMEQHLGRKLKPDEIVHHIDGDNTNNDINNLQIMSQSEHINLHRKEMLEALNSKRNGDGTADNNSL